MFENDRQKTNLKLGLAYSRFLGTKLNNKYIKLNEKSLKMNGKTYNNDNDYDNDNDNDNDDNSNNTTTHEN